MGLLPRDQLNLATYEFSTYKKSSGDSQRSNASEISVELARSELLEAAWDFGRVAGGRPITIEFVGVWDTIASIIVPRRDRLIPDLQTLRFTRTNPTVRIFRQAMPIDERRRFFRLNRWIEPQRYRANPYRADSEVKQDARQVWFSGVHSDIGGGYPETESALSKYPLIWMLQQASDAGLELRPRMVRRLAFGQGQATDKYQYAAPSAQGELHNSMTAAWSILEWLPKRVRWREDNSRRSVMGWYLPSSEARNVPDGAIVHYSVFQRVHSGGYAPPNLPSNAVVEEKSTLERALLTAT